MLNARLYRTAWLVAAVALVVALLTLEPPQPAAEPALPAAFSGEAALALDEQLRAQVPSRPPGSAADELAARLVEEQLAQVPGAEGRVIAQPFEARDDGRPVALRNVYLAVPGRADGGPDGGIVVVAPRDTPEGVSGGTSSTALLLRLARLSATTAHRRPHLFVSADGATIGDAGLRWFLTRFAEFPISAVVVLDAPGAAVGDDIHLWATGAGPAQALGLAGIAETAVGRVGARPVPGPGVWGQVLRLAVPRTSGGQGAAIAAGIPAVTLAGRPDGPLATVDEAPSPERLALAGDAANALLATLDVTERVPPPDASLGLTGQVLRPTLARLSLLLLALPVIAVALEAGARMRRARVPLAPGLRALGRRAAPLLAGLATAHVLVLAGLLPGHAAGQPPLAGAVRLDARAGLGVALAALVAALVWWRGRRASRASRPPRDRAATPDAEAAVAILALAVTLVVAWLVTPFVLALALPAAHAGLVATAARRRWQVAALAAVAALPLLVVLLELGGRLDRDPAFAAWYLLDTVASGTQGAALPLVAVAVAACVWALGALVAFRARKGLVVAAPRGGRR